MTERENIPLTGLKTEASNDVQIVETKYVVQSSASTKSAGDQSTKSIGTTELTVSGGSGGVLVYLANAYITNMQLKGLLVALAPTLGIIMISIYRFISAQVVQRWTSRKEEQTRLELLKKAKDGLETAKGFLASIEADGNATPEHKAKARDRVQSIERAVIDLSVKGIVVIE